MSAPQIVLFVITTAMSYAMRASMDDTLTDTGREEGIKVNTRSTQESINIVYGHRKVSGNDVFGYTCGNENRDLYLVTTLSEGECDSLYQDGGVDQIWLGDKLWNEYGGNVSYWFYSGSTNQTVNTTLQSATSGATTPWTDTLENTCYIVMKLHYDKDHFRGIPSRQFELKGKKVYDFRTETTGYSTNPVLCLYDFFINTRYGLGYSSNQIDTDSWTTVANYCDTKGWTLNYVMDVKQSAWSIVEEILDHFRGIINWWDGKFYLKYADLNDEASVMTIEDKHIVQDTSGRAAITINQPGKFSKPDGIKVKFVDKDRSFATDDVIVGDTIGVINTFNMLGCTDREMASNLAVSRLERAQLDRAIMGTFRDDCIYLEPHDIITFNSTALGISDQLMRVTGTTIRSAGIIDLSLQYENYAIYNDDYDLDVEGTYTCDLPDPNDEPPGVSNSSIEEVLDDYRLRSKTKLVVSFDEPVDYAWYDHVEVWLATTTSGVTDDFYHDGNVTTGFEINNVEDDQDYWVLLRVVNTWGVKQTLEASDKLHLAVVGVADSPTSLAYLSAIVNDGSTINFHSDKLDNPDIEIYEFRLGSSWSGGVFLTSARSPNYSLTGVKPGIFDFTANTKGTNNLYGSTPRSASAIIYEPKGWTLYDNSTYTDDYSTIDGTNVEQTTYAGDYYLKCSHTSDILTGTYYSPVFDLGVGNNDRYYVYVDAEVVVTGAGTTWNYVTASGTSTWEDISATTTTWNDLFEIEAAPSVAISLYYKESVTDDWSVAERMEICSTDVTARYFQVKIVITDPTPAVTALVEEFTIVLYS